jgi:hypothetical protein
MCCYLLYYRRRHPISSLPSRGQPLLDILNEANLNHPITLNFKTCNLVPGVLSQEQESMQ